MISLSQNAHGDLLKNIYAIHQSDKLNIHAKILLFIMYLYSNLPIHMYNYTKVQNINS